MATKERFSNMELLRLIAMFLILVVHTNFFLIGPPSQGGYKYLHVNHLHGF